MNARLACLTAILLVVGGPAFADCAEELAALQNHDQTASSTTAPATPHQNESVGGGMSSTQGTAAQGPEGPASAASPHQMETLGGGGAGMPPEAGGVTGEEQVATLLGGAQDMQSQGNEQGCMDLVNQAKQLMGAQ
ncbi:hypothetical protein [Marinivivus vitaminiproducens]|uniref:hypothetical protein n=1 Tax=Marinivivus vitaminiproducens TaxID=3035935 RepID=UPI00279BD429|nr:hypothetical protein P4R82_18630 [Geminicoccaceae bacterium SCSIO 64248]